jgi:hypothetical protein
VPGKTGPVHRAELEDEPAPRICVATDVEPNELERPLRQLATLCGGQPAPLSLDDVPESPNPRKGIEAMGRVFLAKDIEQLERKVTQHPANGEAWAQLGRSIATPIGSRMRRPPSRRRSRSGLRTRPC